MSTGARARERLEAAQPQGAFTPCILACFPPISAWARAIWLASHAIDLGNATAPPQIST